MSINIYFVASREVQVLKTGKIETQAETFDVWQTPTEVSYEIQNSENPVEKYREWIKSTDCDSADRFYVQDHLAQFDAWCKEVQSEGFEITVELI